ncbi:MAG: extracellular solute-binding protein [Anaerolineales bacterium]|nr:extracellular solute-binding protein [Anaerolineales bacterium]
MGKAMKKFTWFVILLLLALAGCSQLGIGGEQETPLATASATLPQPAVTPTPTAPAPPTPQVLRGTLTIWHAWGEQAMPVLEQILENFSASHPEVLFDVLYMPQENLRARFESAVLEGGGPDLLLGPAELGPELYRAGWLQDLSALVGEPLLATINPAALSPAYDRGALVGLPYAQQGVVLYRNRALINRQAENFDELISLAKAATQGELIGADLEHGLFFSGGSLVGLGGQWMQADGSPAFNTPQGLAWLDLLNKFALAGPTEYLSERDTDLFKEGRVGWIIDGTWNLSELSASLGSGNLAVDPWPSIPGGRMAGFVQAANLYLSAASQAEDREAIGLFVDHFLSPESQALLLEGGLIPVVSRVSISDPNQELLMEQVFEALAGGTGYPSAPEMNLYLGPLDLALQSVLRGGAAPAEALTTAEQAILIALAQANATPTPAP